MPNGIPTQGQFLNALQGFRREVNQLQATRALTQANEQVRAIRDRTIDGDKKLQDIRDVAANLGVAFLETGQSVQQTQLAQQGLLGQFQAQPTTRFEQQKELQRKGQEFREETRVKRETRLIGKEKRATLTRAQTEFNRFTKNVRKATTGARNAISVLEAGGPGRKLAGSAVRILLARASGEVGNLTAAEQEAFAGRQDIASSILRKINQGLFSEVTAGDRAALRDIAQIYLTTASSAEREFATSLTNQLRANELFADDDPNKLISGVSGKRVTSIEEVPVPQQGTAIAPAIPSRQTVDQTKGKRRHFTPIRQE